VNLGAVNKVSMKELRALFEKLGHENVQTYLQSGNVVFDAHSATVKKITAELEKAVLRTFNVESSIVLRTRRQLQRVVEGFPYSTRGARPSSMQVMFLAKRPSPRAVKTLDTDRSPPDKFQVSGSEIYLWFPGGSGRSKLSIDYFEKNLQTRGTLRNLNTITKLLELMQR
jgi:uncharacterized protein (DUF1697 family)